MGGTPPPVGWVITRRCVVEWPRLQARFARFGLGGSPARWAPGAYLLQLLSPVRRCRSSPRRLRIRRWGISSLPRSFSRLRVRSSARFGGSICGIGESEIGGLEDGKRASRPCARAAAMTCAQPPRVVRSAGRRPGQHPDHFDRILRSAPPPGGSVRRTWFALTGVHLEVAGSKRSRSAEPVIVVRVSAL